MAAARASVADISARSAARTASPPKPCRARLPRPSLVAAIIFPHTKWLPKITDYRGTAALIFASSTLKQLTIRGSFTGAVCNTSWYPKFNGSHFGLPPSSSCIKWLDWVAQWCERWRMRSGPFKGQCHDIQWYFCAFCMSEKWWLLAQVSRTSDYDSSVSCVNGFAAQAKSSKCRFPRSCLVAAIIFPHTKWLTKNTDYRNTAT